MAIEKITRAKGIIYRAVWVNPISGRRESKSFDNELDAKQHEIDRRKTARDDPQAFSGPPPSTTVLALALNYMDHAGLSKSTKAVETYNLEIAIFPVIGTKDATTLTNAEARSSILLISTKKFGQLDTSSSCPFFVWVVGVGKGKSNRWRKDLAHRLQCLQILCRKRGGRFLFPFLLPRKTPLDMGLTCCHDL